MAESRFGYANVHTGKYSNEQNIRNLKSFADSMSEAVSFYVQTLENEIEELKAEIEKIRKE